MIATELINIPVRPGATYDEVTIPKNLAESVTNAVRQALALITPQILGQGPIIIDLGSEPPTSSEDEAERQRDEEEYAARRKTEHKKDVGVHGDSETK